MEKLQAAIETARKKRATAGRADPIERAPRTKGPAPENADLWSALEEYAPGRSTLASNLVVAQTPSQEAAPFDVLRTKLLLQMRQNGWKRLAITSPMAQCGKTTIACNLALGLQRQTELRTMLFDLDLRDPSVGAFLGHRPERSVSDVLSGEVDFADQAIRIGRNLAVSIAADRDRDPTRLLLAEQTGRVFDALEERYAPDIMIFDLPSLLVNDETRAFLKNVDCALIVGRAGVTKFGHFDSCEREVAEHTNVLGVVLNAYRSHGGS